jgi:Transposase DDE domain group 1
VKRTARRRGRPRRRIAVSVDADGLVGLAGAVLLAETAAVVGLDRGLSVALAPWRKPRAVHDPGKVVLDLGIMLAAGGDCPADLAALRAGPGVFGPVASDPTVSRLVDTLAAAGQPALAAVRAARAKARARAWKLAGAPVQRRAAGRQQRGQPEAVVVLDFDATIVISHSDKEQATRTWKKTYGHHPLGGWVDHGEGGTGEPTGWLLRPGRAGSNTAADHVVVFEQALAQLPAECSTRDQQGRRPVLVRTDGAGATHRFAEHLHQAGVEYSLGFTLGVEYHQSLLAVPAAAWSPAYNAGGEERDGAWVAELTGLVDLTGWPDGARLIVRKERPHPGAQLRFTDADGHRFTAFLTNTQGCQLADLELRHRRHARVEDRIRTGKDTGLRNLPFQHLAQNALWLELVALAQDLLAHTQRLALTGAHRIAEPKTLRYQLFHTPGRLARTARRTLLRLSRTWPWANDLAAALARLAALPAP